MKNSRIAFIGAGNMAESLIRGLLAQGASPERIGACDIDQNKLDALRERCGIDTPSLSEAAARADVLVLAVKPQALSGVCRELAGQLPADCLVVSVAAGIPLSALESWLGGDRPIVRTMPNTPALVGEGATALFANPVTSEEQKRLAGDIMSAVGVTCWLQRESDIDTVTALSGSGPAYFFLMMEAMENAARDMGLDADIARRFAIQTALGAGRLAATEDASPAELRRRVSSPGGTTEQAIQSLSDDEFPRMIAKAMRAAHQRSAELSGKTG